MTHENGLNKVKAYIKDNKSIFKSPYNRKAANVREVLFSFRMFI